MAQHPPRPMQSVFYHIYGDEPSISINFPHFVDVKTRAFHGSRPEYLVLQNDLAIGQAAQQTMQYVVLYLIPTLVEALAVLRWRCSP